MASDWPSFLDQRTGGYPVERGRTPVSPTSVLRAQQRMEAAQQATTELSVLTEQLIELPERLQRSYLADQRSAQLQAAMEAYAILASMAWQGIATDTLDSVTATTEYRQRAVAATRRVSRLQQEAATSHPLPEDDLTTQVLRPRQGVLWKFRVALYRDALIQWRLGLGFSQGSGPNVQQLGNAMQELRGAVGEASMSNTSLILTRTILLFGQLIGGVITTLYVAAAASALTLNLPSISLPLSITAIFLVFFWGFLLWTSSLSVHALGAIQGEVRWRLQEREQGDSRFFDGGRWGALLLGLLLSLAAAGASGWFIYRTIPQDAIALHGGTITGLLQLTAGPLFPMLVGLAGVLFFVPLIMALPATLAYQSILVREMARSTGVIPLARKVPLAPALHVLMLHILYILILALGALRFFHLTWKPFYQQGPLQVSWLTIIIAGIVLGAYLLFINVPYRMGSERWRQGLLALIGQQREEVSARISRFAPEPTDAQDVVSIQYDVARLQYLQLREQEVRRQSLAPYSVAEQVIALFIVLVVSFLLENGIMLAARLFS